jgi:protein-S-isoprenylcysteine O-methyltransferase Ste14
MRPLEIFMAWFAYLALHSLLAASATKAWVGHRWPHLMPSYRLAFNLISIVTLLPVLWLVYGTEGDWLWRWKGALAWVANGAALIALLCFFASTRAYDMDEFLGLRQLRAHGSDDNQTFTLSFFHRFVRHPWYCFALILIWTRDMSMPFLVSAVAISIYFLVGSKLEEQKLVAIYGEKYRRYMQKVPGLVPLPWKYLTARDADTLLNSPG